MSWDGFVAWFAGATRAEWISIASLLIAALAFWRSGRVRTLDLQATVRRQCAELQLALESLATTIPAAVESRARIAAMTGQTGALQHFTAEADSDKTSVEGLKSRVDAINRIRVFVGYRAVEKRAIDAYEISTQVRKLREKYQRAADADNDVRRRRQDDVLAQIGSGRP